jgi:hypothetical protein
MFRTSRSVLLVTMVSLAGSGILVAPGAASAADTTTHLSATQMVAALKPVATASAAAAEGGWKSVLRLAGDSSPVSGTYVVDPSRGIAYEQFRYGEDNETAYAVAGKGLYRTLPDAASRAAVKMMGRPAVKYVFSPDGSLTLDEYLKDGAPTPDSVLGEDLDNAGTRTVHDDGSADYVQVVDDTTVTLRVSPAGTLSGAHAKTGDYTVTLTYTYGPQTVAAPAAETVIDEAALNVGVWYVHLPVEIKQVSHLSAAKARRAAHGATVKVASLRKIVRQEVSTFNTKAQLKMIKVKNIDRGVRVYATNPWTHKTFSYTIKASGKKVVVRR